MAGNNYWGAMFLLCIALVQLLSVSSAPVFRGGSALSLPRFNANIKVCNTDEGTEFGCTRHGKCAKRTLTFSCVCEPLFKGFGCDLGHDADAAKKFKTNMALKKLAVLAASTSNQAYEESIGDATKKCPMFKSLKDAAIVKLTGTQKNFLMHGVSEGTPFITFRGTDSSATFAQDVQSYPADLVLSSGKKVRVHTGFHKAIMQNKDQIFDIVKIVLKGRKTILLSGHSLGGAMAAFFSVLLHDKFPGVTISLITFGKPRVGGMHFAQLVESSCTGGVYRFVNVQGSKADPTLDKVPTLPNVFPKGLQNFYYVHAGDQVSLGVGDQTEQTTGAVLTIALHGGDLYQKRVEQYTGLNVCSGPK